MQPPVVVTSPCEHAERERGPKKVALHQGKEVVVASLLRSNNNDNGDVADDPGAVSSG